jgi:putative transposase
LFGISRQVYYRSVKSRNKRQHTASAVLEQVRQVRNRMPQIGTRKLYHLLEPSLRKIAVGRDKLFWILRANHMLIVPKRSYHITTNSHHRFRKHKNLIDKLKVSRPEQVWVADITYLGNRENPSYLALVTDAYSKKIVGYCVSAHLDTDNCIKALKMAIAKRIYKRESLIHHSDRGIQYCSKEYQSVLKNNGINCSMTQSYDPYQNAVAERVNGILKQEFSIDKYNVELKLRKKIVSDSVRIYNTDRPHYSCHMKTPEQMHLQRQIRIRTYKTESRQNE